MRTMRNVSGNQNAAPRTTQTWPWLPQTRPACAAHQVAPRVTAEYRHQSNCWSVHDGATSSGAIPSPYNP